MAHAPPPPGGAPPGRAEDCRGQRIIALRNLREGGFAGPVHLVNPHHPAIDGVPAVASLDAIDPAPEVVVITAPAPEVPGIVAAAGARGVAAAVIISAGLGHGAGSLAETARTAAGAHGLRVLGPNGLGLIVPGAHLNAIRMRAGAQRRHSISLAASSSVPTCRCSMTRREKKLPGVVALHDRVAKRPRIASYLASERRIAFNEQGIFQYYKELDG